jgi:hypothetical protein
MIINIIIYVAIYVLIGVLIHHETEPLLRKRHFMDYSRSNFITLLLDYVFWLPMLIIYVIVKIRQWIS